MKMNIARNFRNAWQSGRITVTLIVIAVIVAIATSPGFRAGAEAFAKMIRR